MGGLLLLQGGGFNGVMLMLIGWFGLGANRSQSQMLVLHQVLQDLKVADAASRRFRVMDRISPASAQSAASSGRRGQAGAD